MAQQLGNVAVGTIVKINESGVPADFYVACQNYESGLNGAGRTLVVRKNVYDLRAWNSLNVNAWANCSMRAWLNSTYKALLDSDIQSLMGTTKYYYTPGNGSWSVTIRSDAVFLLSITELGRSQNWFNAEGFTLPIASALLIARKDGSATTQWTRSPNTTSTEIVGFVSSGGLDASDVCAAGAGSRPAFTLPFNLAVSDDGTIDGTLYYSVPTLTVPDIIMQGQSVPLSWAAADGATTYILERNVDSGGWVQAYSGPNTEFKDTAEFWSTVQYRVKAGDGTNYGEYTESVTIPVVSANALVISGEDKDLGTINSDIHYTVVSDTGNEISLVRKVNGQQVTVMTVDSGFSYDIPVIDLPTGSGTIEITASVNTSGGSPVTATRTWTYFKPHFAFPRSGGIAQLSQGGNNVFPPTLAEAVRVPPEYGGTLDKTLERLTEYIVPVTGITLTVKAPQGATVTATNRGTTLTETADDGTCQFTLTAFGEWTIKAVLEDKSATTTVTVDTAKPYEVSIGFYDPVLNNNTWEQIAQAAREGKAAELWQVGDTKTITLNGKVGKGLTLDNLSIDVFIVGIDHNPDIEGRNKIHFQLGKIDGKLVGLVDSKYNTTVSETGYFSMNAANANAGGWDGSQMKANILVGNGTPSSPVTDTLLAALPADLRAVMVGCTKYTDNVGGGTSVSGNVTKTQEYICLLDEFEISGSSVYGNTESQNYQKQYEYYKSGNSKIHYKHSDNYAEAISWTRGVQKNVGTNFCSIKTNGDIASDGSGWSESISPIFFVG